MIEWAAISKLVLPHIKKYVTEKATKLATDYADSQLAKLYKRLAPDEKLAKTTMAREQLRKWGNDPGTRELLATEGEQG